MLLIQVLQPWPLLGGHIVRKSWNQLETYILESYDLINEKKAYASVP